MKAAKYITLLFLSFSFLFGYSAALWAADIGQKKAIVVVSNATAPATAPGQNEVALSLTLDNKGPEDDVLLSASSPAFAKSIRLLETFNQGAKPSKRPLKQLDVPVDRPVTLTPGTVFLQLENLKRPLRKGEHIAVVLRFQKSGPQQISVYIQ
jgi:copper(I)-binding protein